MNPRYDDLLKNKSGEESYRKLTALSNRKLYNVVGEFVAHCNPKSLYVCSDGRQDEAHVRRIALEKCEEHPLAMNGQTMHYDRYGDHG